jgi:hypothetical protein
MSRHQDVRTVEIQHMAVTDQLHALRALNPKKHHSCPLNQMLDEPWIWPGYCEGVSNLLPMLEIEPRFLCRLARSLGATSSALSQLATGSSLGPTADSYLTRRKQSYHILYCWYSDVKQLLLDETLRVCSLLTFPVLHFWYSWTK